MRTACWYIDYDDALENYWIKSGQCELGPYDTITEASRAVGRVLEHELHQRMQGHTTTVEQFLEIS